MAVTVEKANVGKVLLLDQVVFWVGLFFMGLKSLFVLP